MPRTITNLDGIAAVTSIAIEPDGQIVVAGVEVVTGRAVSQIDGTSDPIEAGRAFIARFGPVSDPGSGLA